MDFKGLYQFPKTLPVLGRVQTSRNQTNSKKTIDMEERLKRAEPTRPKSTKMERYRLKARDAIPARRNHSRVRCSPPPLKITARMEIIMPISKTIKQTTIAAKYFPQNNSRREIRVESARA